MKITIDQIAETIFLQENKTKASPEALCFSDLPYHKKLTYKAKAALWIKVFRELRKTLI